MKHRNRRLVLRWDSEKQIPTASALPCNRARCHLNKVDFSCRLELLPPPLQKPSRSPTEDRARPYTPPHTTPPRPPFLSSPPLPFSRRRQVLFSSPRHVQLH